MENSLKQRIVGAIVLIALAVIFLPAILKEKQNIEPFESQIPEKPIELVNKTSSKEDNKKIEAVRSKLNELESKKTENDAQNEDSTDQPLDDVIESEASKVQAKSDSKGSDKSSASKQDQSGDQQRKADSHESAEKETIGKDFKDAAWLVKVASFSSKDNATRLVSKLKEAKLKAYSRKASVQNKTIYRVYVGPFINKSEAQKALENVSKISATKGIVVPFDPAKH